LDIGTGNFIETNYPGIPTQVPIPANETVDNNGGRVFYTSTDQDGNFRVGELFSIEQSTGVATLNADAFNIAGLSELKELYQTRIPVLFDQTYDIVQQADIAIVTSGTATLETALLNTPQIVVYKTDWVFYSLAKIVIQIKYISLVNIILDKLTVPELIQAKFSVEHMTAWLRELLTKGTKYQQQKEDYKQLQKLVGEAGASKKTAQLIYSAASAK
jgi:lipid A disaccharide synthetase